LQKRDPDLLDRLIEQYQYRLFRYLVYITGNKERLRIFSGNVDRVRTPATSTTVNPNLKRGSLPCAPLVIDWPALEEAQSLDSADRSGAENLSNSPTRKNLLPCTRSSHETQEKVQASLSQIPAIIREVLVLPFQEGVADREMAGVSPVPLSTVKSRSTAG